MLGCVYATLTGIPGGSGTFRPLNLLFRGMCSPDNRYPDNYSDQKRRKCGLNNRRKNLAPAAARPRVARPPQPFSAAASPNGRCFDSPRNLAPTRGSRPTLPSELGGTE